MCDSKKTPWRLTCKELLRSFNALEQFDDFDSIQEVAAYIREEIGVRPCPSPEVELEIAGAQGDDAVYVKRQCRPNESLFVDIGKGLALASTICGQYIRNEVGFFSATTDSPVEASIGDPELTNLRASIDEIARRMTADRNRAKEKKVDSHWYTPTPAKVGAAAVVAVAVVCAVAPGHCGLIRQEQKVVQNVCIGGACR
ncbi:MAG: hypothetical protein AAB780_00255 [Patescibacteria group bacterium]